MVRVYLLCLSETETDLCICPKVFNWSLATLLIKECLWLITECKAAIWLFFAVRKYWFEEIMVPFRILWIRQALFMDKCALTTFTIIYNFNVSLYLLNYIPVDCKEIQPVHPKGSQSWVFIGRTAAEAETPILWPPDVKSWLNWKDPDAGKDWGQEEKGTTGWDGWMTSLTQWTWVWVDSGSWWLTGRPGVLQFMGLQRVRYDWVTELNWTEYVFNTWYVSIITFYRYWFT